ncbi:DUF493 domain-containing protein [Deferribacter autotrophicus]|uniref:DUF493 domain-containing protein n=1 Tax=Deferribacter autotrophicus TaxID=500465 RepID=A0A5A8F5Z1_9BACT|nr:DUF493 domain-containing protein [Deferribacter autotrophicus]KAA0259487.1 DUF493 domain-containing protein [Deferribacter autotrophicus]
MKGIDKQKIKDLIDFPVIYTFKIIGVNSDSFILDVEGIFSQKEILSLKWEKSRLNKYISATVIVEISNEDELIAYYEKIKAIKEVKYFL